MNLNAITPNGTVHQLCERIVKLVVLKNINPRYLIDSKFSLISEAKNDDFIGCLPLLSSPYDADVIILHQIEKENAIFMPLPIWMTWIG